MARTKQNAAKSTGGKAPRFNMAKAANRKYQQRPVMRRTRRRSRGGSSSVRRGSAVDDAMAAAQAGLWVGEEPVQVLEEGEVPELEVLAAGQAIDMGGQQAREQRAGSVAGQKTMARAMEQRVAVPAQETTERAVEQRVAVHADQDSRAVRAAECHERSGAIELHDAASVAGHHRASWAAGHHAAIRATSHHAAAMSHDEASRAMSHDNTSKAMSHDEASRSEWRRAAEEGEDLGAPESGEEPLGAREVEELRVAMDHEGLHATGEGEDLRVSREHEGLHTTGRGEALAGYQAAEEHGLLQAVPGRGEERPGEERAMQATFDAALQLVAFSVEVNGEEASERAGACEALSAALAPTATVASVEEEIGYSSSDDEDWIDDTTYLVNAVVNRRRGPARFGGYEYRVVWWAAEGRMVRTWERRSTLIEDGFGEQLAAVDAWKAARTDSPFTEWAARHRPAVLTASATGRCLFEAFALALQRLGDRVGVPDAEVEAFAEKLAASGVDVDIGIKWKTFSAFVRRISSIGSRVDYAELTINRHTGGHRRQAAIDRLNLSDGVYLVGAFNSYRVGHAFILVVKGSKRTAIDTSGEMPFCRYGKWIENVSFVRKVQLQDK